MLTHKFLLARLSEKVDEFIKQVHVERGQLYRAHSGNDEVNRETDEVFPRHITLFGIRNEAVKGILTETGTVKYFRNG